MKNLLCTATVVLALASLPALPASAQMDMHAKSGAPAKPLLSPAATAETSLDGKTITVHYNSPRVRGRKIMGGLVPYGKPWRTGANPATTLIAPIDLRIGDLNVPAGTHTLFTLPNATEWKLIVSKKTGEWGIPYPGAEFDLGRTPMHLDKLSSPQEDMTISFEKTTRHSTELHVKWDTTDAWVKIEAAK